MQKLCVEMLVGLIAVQHVAFLILEMFLWRRPLGRRVFRLSAEAAESTATLAANQGLYNGFLAAGLLWSLFQPDPLLATQLRAFFLGCVAVAGVFGAATVSLRILYVQAAPALLGLALVFLPA